MKRLFIFIFILHASFCFASPPARVYTYTTGTTIESTAVTTNEDQIFNYLQAGVDTYSDGTIVNADVASNAAIAASKLDLATITQDMTHSGTFTQSGSASFTTISDLGAVTTTGAITLGGKVTGGANEIEGSLFDINGGAIDNTTVGAATPSTGAFTTLKVGTTNQGDILYDNGTSMVRLTPGTAGQALQTGGDGANPSWANLVSQVNDVETDGVSFETTNEATILSVEKTITSGKTVLLIASGYISNNNTGGVTIKLKNGDTVSQTIVFGQGDGNWSSCAIVTGLSGSTTFTVTMQGTVSSTNRKGYGNLIVLEF